MSRKTAPARSGQDRTSLYDEITGKLEAGRVPWAHPWGTAAAKAPLAMPRNAATGRHYSGINVLILWGAVIEHGFPSQSWLTFRQALALELGGGFGTEVRDAMRKRVDHLVREGLAQRAGERVRFERGLVSTLQEREVRAVGEKLARKEGKMFEAIAAGDNVTGVYRKRLALASGRYAMIDNGLGFQLVPWTPSVEKQIGLAVSGVVSDAGFVGWDFLRSRGAGIGR